MSLRAAQQHLRAADGTVSATQYKPLPLPDYTNIERGSDEAAAVMNEWRPALYGYFGRLAMPAYQELQNMRTGPFGLWHPGIRINRGQETRNQLLESLTSQAPLAQHLEILEFLRAMNIEASKRAMSPDNIEAENLEVVFAHAEQLREMFHALEGGIRLESAKNFLASGFNTAAETTVKFHYVSAELLQPIGHGEAQISEAVTQSRFLQQMAALELGQMLAATDALSLGVYKSSDLIFRPQPFDPRAFAVYGSGPKIVVAPKVSLPNLIDPNTCAWDYKQNSYDLSTGTTIGDMPKLSTRKGVGCLGLLSLNGQEPIISQNARWIADVVQRTGALTNQLDYIAKSTYVEPPFRGWDGRVRWDGSARGPSIATLMIEAGMQHGRTALDRGNTTVEMDLTFDALGL